MKLKTIRRFFARNSWKLAEDRLKLKPTKLIRYSERLAAHEQKLFNLNASERRAGLPLTINLQMTKRSLVGDQISNIVNRVADFFKGKRKDIKIDV